MLAHSLCICIFLATAEIAIVSTSLVTISADLSGFDKSNWLVTAYLSAFTGVSNLAARSKFPNTDEYKGFSSYGPRLDITLALRRRF